MRSRLTLKPPQRGTKKLQAKYGDRLLYVRYRYDEERRRRCKTVELIVNEVDWVPKQPQAPGTRRVELRSCSATWLAGSNRWRWRSMKVEAAQEHLDVDARIRM